MNYTVRDFNEGLLKGTKEINYGTIRLMALKNENLLFIKKTINNVEPEINDIH